MHTTDTSQNLNNLKGSYNVWQPIVIIVLQVLRLGFSSMKYYLNNKSHTSLLKSIKKNIQYKYKYKNANRTIV